MYNLLATWIGTCYEPVIAQNLISKELLTLQNTSVVLS